MLHPVDSTGTFNRFFNCKGRQVLPLTAYSTANLYFLKQFRRKKEEGIVTILYELILYASKKERNSHEGNLQRSYEDDSKRTYKILMIFIFLYKQKKKTYFFYYPSHHIISIISIKRHKFLTRRTLVCVR